MANGDDGWEIERRSGCTLGGSHSVGSACSPIKLATRDKMIIADLAKLPNPRLLPTPTLRSHLNTARRFVMYYVPS